MIIQILNRQFWQSDTDQCLRLECVSSVTISDIVIVIVTVIIIIIIIISTIIRVSSAQYAWNLSSFRKAVYTH